MKKQMIVIAMMSMIVTLAGCAGETDISGITKNIPADSVTAAVTSAPDKTDAETPVDSKADESKPDEKTEKKEKTESKSDEKKEDPGTPEIKPEEKTAAPTGKKVAAADVSEIVGEWFDFDPVSPRKITVNSDASYEISSGNGFSGIVTSGTVTTETVNGVKKFSFIDSENGLWYVPFELAPSENGDCLQTEENPVYETVKFFRNVGDPGNAGNPIIDIAPIIGTWYEEDADIGRTITVNEDGTYTANGVSAGTISYTQEREMDYAIEYYTFTDNERGLWYTFRFMNNSFPELISYRNEVHETVSFSREPSSVRSSEAMSKIIGTWYADDPSYPTLVVNDDGSYAMLADDGSAEKTNIVKVEIRNGVEKYTFKDDMLGTWLVPFEVRNGGSVLVTEDNPVFGIISFHR